MAQTEKDEDGQKGCKRWAEDRRTDEGNAKEVDKERTGDQGRVGCAIICGEVAVPARRELRELPLVRGAVHRDDLRRVTEAFITSASREILPVVRIDDEPIGDGRVGRATRAIMDAFAGLVARERDDRF